VKLDFTDAVITSPTLDIQRRRPTAVAVRPMTYSSIAAEEDR
jgi:hypothetical protein